MPGNKLTGRDIVPADRTFRRTERIRRRGDYVWIQGSGRKLRSPNLLAFVVRSSPALLPRLGITVSRRVGGAVVRNHVKRLIRETFRLNKLCFPQGFDVVIVARSESAWATFNQISENLKQIARQIAQTMGSANV